jgi:hypothetical protein
VWKTEIGNSSASSRARSCGSTYSSPRSSSAARSSRTKPMVMRSATKLPKASCARSRCTSPSSRRPPGAPVRKSIDGRDIVLRPERRDRALRNLVSSVVHADDGEREQDDQTGTGGGIHRVSSTGVTWRAALPPNARTVPERAARRRVLVERPPRRRGHSARALAPLHECFLRGPPQSGRQNRLAHARTDRARAHRCRNRRPLP